MILLRVISTRHCATSCFMTFGTSMIPESSNAFVGQALVDGDFLTQIFQAARDLAAEIGISYSEALGFTLGIKDVTYGWEEDYTEEEFQALIDHAVGDTDYEHTLY